ncbi:site-2 protease family protein [Candidatus Daviesbacteria bacterium]|nr:site-2 protease family protein [Candidatus Daviesbacteria bacterium]
MNPEFLAISIVILLFSVILHEVMHGYVALKFGDKTALNAGRLTLNPIPHIDLVGTILLPGLLLLSGSPILFGWAKPVPVNPLHFNDLKRGELLVSAAGILANLGLALVSAVLFHILGSFSSQPFLSQIFYFTADINLLLAVFNLLPIPPLDGSKVLLSQLSYNLARQYQAFEQYGFLILLGLMLVRVGSTSLLGAYLGFVVGILKSFLGL